MSRRGARSVGLLALLGGCTTAATGGPSAGYGGLRDPFPVSKSETPAATTEPIEPMRATDAPAPSTPAPAASGPGAGTHCGPACALCSRAAETCDEEVRRTGAWNGPQCARKNEICAPLTALRNATGCTCE